MKAKAKVNANAKQQAATPAAVKVPASVVSAVKSCLTARAAVERAVKEEVGKWEACGLVLKKEFATREEAAPVLKKAFENEGKKPSEQPYASYVSKILGFGFPHDAAMSDLAKKEGLSTNDRAMVNSGTMKKVGKKWVKVEKATKSGNRAKKSGGHNRKKPVDTFSAAQALAFTGASTAKLDCKQVAIAIYEATKDTIYRKKGSADELLEALKEAFGE